MFRFLERLIENHTPLWGHVADNIIMTDAGGMFAMIEVQGFAWETRDSIDIRDMQLRWNHTLKNIAAPDLIISVYQTRGVHGPEIYPVGEFQTEFAERLDRAYKANLFKNTLYNNRTFVGIHVLPSAATDVLSEYIALRQSKPVENPDEERIYRIKQIISLVSHDLRFYGPRLLGLRQENFRCFSEIAETLVYVMSGHWRKVPLTTGRIGNAMFSENVHVVHDHIAYTFPGSIQYGAIFGMKHFPAWTWPGMFSNLLASPYRSSTIHTFRFIPTAQAQAIMKRKTYRMRTAEDPAVDQAEALARAANGLAQQDYAFGDYSFSHLVFASDLDRLSDVATVAWGLLADSQMVVARENLGLEAALFSFIPGNERLRPRPGYVSSLNFSSMVPLHSYPKGKPRGYWGEPLCLFRTAGGVPYQFHLHVDDVGNTFVCGRTGSGKTTWLGFVIAQAERLGATTVLFDKDNGLKILCHFLGGTYLELDTPTGLAPLKALTNSESDLAFLGELIRGCIMAGNNKPLTEEENRRLRLGLEIMMSLPPDDRDMWELRAFLGNAPEGAGMRLEKWCRGREFGGIIDNEKDLISLDAKVIGFDQTKILDNVMARGPVMATLYHYLDKLIDGRRLLFIIDEFWKSLQDESFRALVNDKLRTLRKQNSPMMLCTQSPKEGITGELRTVIRDQCLTSIYFRNARADPEHYGENGMGLTMKEIDIVKSLTIGEFLLRQDTVSVPASLVLDGLDDEISVLSTNKVNLKVFNRIERERREIGERYLQARREELV